MTGFKQTGAMTRSSRLRCLPAGLPQAVRCFDLGTSPEGRPMKAMAVSTSGALDEDRAGARPAGGAGAGGIHAGEIDGRMPASAGRDLLQGKVGKGLLDKRCCCSCRCSTSTATRTSAHEPPNQRPRADGPASPRSATTSTAIT
jgi:hypothetical protein